MSLTSAFILLGSSYAPYSPSCQDAPFNTYPHCNHKLSTAERINDLYPRLTLGEKNNVTNSNQGGVHFLRLRQVTLASTVRSGLTPARANHIQ